MPSRLGVLWFGKRHELGKQTSQEHSSTGMILIRNKPCRCAATKGVIAGSGKADSSVSKPALLSAQFKRKFDVTSLGAKAGPAGKIVYEAYWILLTSRETDSQTTFKDFGKFYGWVPALLPWDCGEPAPKMSRIHGMWVLTLNPGNFLPSTITRTIAKQKQKRGMQ